MKSFTLIAVAGTLFATVAQSAYVDLVTLNAAGFTVDGVSTTAPYTQSALGLNYSPSLTLGETLGGVFVAAPLDWSAYTAQVGSAFAVKISISGTNPDLPFSLALFDPSVSDFLTFSGTTAGATTDTYVALSVVGVPTPAQLLVLGNVGGMQFTWDGGGSANVTTQTIAAVPEPSTYALLTFSGLALGGYLVRRRRSP